VSIEESFDRVLTRARELRDTLAAGQLDPGTLASYSKELSDLEPLSREIEAVRAARAELADLEQLMATEGDPELRSLAEAEYYALKARLPELERRVQVMLLPRDEADERDALLEVRAGTGGDEAALFAADLFAMYQRYAALHGWRFEVLEAHETDIGGVKEAVASISGRNVFARLK